MKCYKTVLKIKSLKNNYGFFIIGFIVLLYFITLLIFTTVSFNELKKDINKIIFALKVNEIPIQNKQIKQIKQTIKKPIEINNRIISLIKKDQTKKLGKNIIILKKNIIKPKINISKKKIFNINIFKKEKNNIYF